MPPLDEPGHDTRRLERYLLGLLSDEDAERIDELSIVDDDVAERLRAVENDLVDAYVRGTLAGELRDRFESIYLSSDRRWQKVEFARSFHSTFDRAAEPADTHKTSFVWRFEAVAALLLLACGALLYQDVRLRSGLNEAQQVSARLSDRAHDLEQQLRNPRASDASAVKAPASSSPAPALPSIALVLLPQTRATGPIATLAVPQGIDRVPFELRLESNDFPRYQAALRDPGTNRIIWRSDRMAARSADNVSTVHLVVPASVLKPQHYAIELDGLTAAGGAELAGSYAFQVVRMNVN